MITSVSNQKVKRLVNLQKKRKARDLEQVFLVEGIRMFREVPFEDLLEIYVSEDFYKKEKELTDRMKEASSAAFEIFSDNVFAHVSDTRTPQGVLCVVRQRSQKDVNLAWKNDHTPLLLVLDNIQDPGNLGTILRTAEAAGVTGILMSSGCVDIYNPKTIRSTMGSVFRMPFWICEDLEGCIIKMKEAGVHTYAAHLAGTGSYDEQNFTDGTAFFIGNEGNGLRDEIAALSDTYLRIPMEGQVESLNAAIAATVLMFEAGRQRRAGRKL